MEILHTDANEPTNVDESSATAASDGHTDEADGILSNIVRLGVAGMYGASNAIIGECLGTNGCGGPVDVGSGNIRRGSEVVTKPAYKRQVGVTGAAAASTKRVKAEAGKAKRPKEV